MRVTIKLISVRNMSTARKLSFLVIFCRYGGPLLNTNAMVVY